MRDFDSGRFYNADCFDAMKEVPDGVVDMILCDLPYGTTACAWDSILPFEQLWAEYKRIIRENGAIVLTASQPFTTVLIASQIEKFRHTWVWDKRFAANVVQAKRQPLKTVEDVIVFSMGNKSPEYFPQMIKRDVPIKAGGTKSNGSIPNLSSEIAKEIWKTKIYDEKYPSSILSYNVREGRGLHPTQKPVALFEYLIKTYTNEGALILDNTAGSGTTAIAAINTNRRWVCIEKDEEYYAKAIERIEGHLSQRTSDGHAETESPGIQEGVKEAAE